MLEFASLSSHEVPTEWSEGEAQSRKMIGLPNHFNLLVCEVPIERSEGEARSPTDASLLAIGSLSLGEVPKRLKGARSMRWVYEVNEYQTCLIECVNNRIRHYLARFRRKRTLGVRK